MKLINVERKETEYTFSFTEKELIVILAAMADSSKIAVSLKVREEDFNNSFNSKDLTEEDLAKVYDIWDTFADVVKVQS